MIFFNGQTGSVGQYLSDALKQTSHSFHALKTRLENHASLKEELSQIDFSKEQTATLIPLAAIVPVGECEKNPDKAFLYNVDYTTKYVKEWLQFFRTNRPSIKLQIFYVSSSHVYQTPKDGHKIKPQDPTDPKTVYSKTKLAAEQSIAEVCKNENISFTIARVFGVIAPKQPTQYLLQGLITRAQTENLTGIKGLKNSRDYLDSRDICATIIKIIEQSELKKPPQILNICSGIPITIESFFKKVLEATHKEHLLTKVTADQSEHYDSPWIVGDPAETESYVGEKIQTITIDQTIHDALLERS